MIRPFALILISISLAACDYTTFTRSSALPDNVKSERPIILKEGQSVLLVPEGNKALMIGAGVTDGELLITEIEPDGRNFSVGWYDEDSWHTSTRIPDGSNQITLIDRDGDGIPDGKIDNTGVYRLKKIEWEKIDRLSEERLFRSTRPRQ